MKRNIRRTVIFLMAIMLMSTSFASAENGEKNIEKNYSYIVNINDKNKDIKKTIIHKGEKYKLREVLSDDRKPIVVRKKVTTQDKDNYSKEIKEKINGKELVLKAEKKSKWEEKAEKIKITENAEYKSRDEIPSSFSKDDKEFKLSNIQNMSKRESFTVPARYITYDPESSEYLFNGQRVTISGNPVWSGYEADIQDYLGISGNDYDISGGNWTSSFMLVDPDEGRYERTASYTGTRSVPYYLATYIYTGDDESNKTYTANINYISSDYEKVLVKAVYEKDNSVFKILIKTGAGILIVGLATSIVIYILKKRKKKGDN